MTPASRNHSPILITPGPRAAEEAVVSAVLRLAGDADVTALARPVRVVVPSKSLRLHLSAELVRRRGRPLVGVRVQTLHAVAVEILDNAGDEIPAGEAFFGVLVERFAREHRELAERLEGLDGGYKVVAGTVRDLLDAGFGPEHLDGVVEALDVDGPAVGSRDEVERAMALARLAVELERGMAALGLGRTSHLFRRAAERLAADPQGVLPARGVLVHGFGDATGVAGDLIEELLRAGRGRIVLDHPPDPAHRDDPDGRRESAFTHRFEERLRFALGARVVEDEVDTPPLAEPPAPARVDAFVAPGPDTEAREVATRVHRLLAGGARPEGIALVGRDLGPYAVPLRRHLERLGVPYSGVGGRGPLTPAGRRVRSLFAVLSRGRDVGADRWLDAVARLPGAAGAEGVGSASVLHDLRLAFATLGAGRLGEVAELPDRLLERDVPLSVRQGFTEIEPRATDDSDEDDGDEDDDRLAPQATVVARRRKVPAARVRAAVVAARVLVAHLAALERPAPLAEHGERLRRLLSDGLGWRPPAPEAPGHGTDPASAQLHGALEELAAQAPAAFELSGRELVTALERQLGEGGSDPLGGQGGGVAVLGAIEGRGRTFDHLFLLGMNRRLFPRQVQEDPLLPDSLRQVLTRVLPQVPVKRQGFDEERYLFAQLLAAAPRVTLSWQSTDDEGRVEPVSPLVERLPWLGPDERPEVAAPWAAVTSRAESGDAAWRPAREHAVLAALHGGDREAVGRRLPLALADSVAAGSDPADLARFQRAVLDEIDPELATPEGRARRAVLGPYFGFVGPLQGTADPRAADVAVTTLEGQARCPWQTFLGRLLRLEPTPDPLQALPGIDARLAGSVVHGVLEEIARRAGVPAPSADHVPGLDELAGRATVAVPWPDAESFEGILQGEARKILAEEGVLLPGLARALAEAARPFLDVARRLEWSDGRQPEILGVEIEGRLEVEGASGRRHAVRFRADRVDRPAGEAALLTDYKTGRKPVSDKKQEATRARHLLQDVARGRRLQVAAYARALPGARGRYLFLAPDIDDDHREAQVGAVDGAGAPAVQSFERVARAVLGAWDLGTFFPRLVEPDRDEEPVACKWCEVKDACLRGDSTARIRLREWAAARTQTTLPDLAQPGAPREPTPGQPPAGPETDRSVEEVLMGVWRLPATDPGQGTP